MFWYQWTKQQINVVVCKQYYIHIVLKELTTLRMIVRLEVVCM